MSHKKSRNKTSVAQGFFEAYGNWESRQTGGISASPSRQPHLLRPLDIEGNQLGPTPASSRGRRGGLKAPPGCRYRDADSSRMRRRVRVFGSLPVPAFMLSTR